jgi:hypothetical protein
MTLPRMTDMAGQSRSLIKSGPAKAAGATWTTHRGFCPRGLHQVVRARQTRATDAAIMGTRRVSDVRHMRAMPSAVAIHPPKSGLPVGDQWREHLSLRSGRPDQLNRAHRQFRPIFRQMPKKDSGSALRAGQHISECSLVPPTITGEYHRHSRFVFAEEGRRSVLPDD